MKEAPGPCCLQVVALYALLMCGAIALLSAHSWAGPDAEMHEARSSTDFAPPLLSYSSVFKRYHGYREEAVASWLEANDTVGRIGGWRAYLEEAFQPDRPELPAPSRPHPASPKNADRHSGHGDKP